MKAPNPPAKSIARRAPSTSNSRYGGFCAGGMSLGRKAPIDPEAWVIVDGKLFLGSSSGAIDYFTTDGEDRMAKADTNWEQLGQTE